jgi:hypothetical protein
MNNQDNNGNSSNGGIYSKFQERLRKIKLSRLKRKQQRQEFIQDRVKEIREALGKEPNHPRNKIKGVGESSEVKDDLLSEVVMDIRATASDRNYVKNKVGALADDKSNVSESTKSTMVVGNELSDKLKNIKENKPVARHGKRVGYVPKFSDVGNISDNEKQELLHNLGVDIIAKIKAGFEDKLDELEVLESELFILSQQQNSELELKRVKEIKDKINELIDRVNSIIDQYNLYKRNYYIDNVIGLDDNVIVDDIISYRTLLGSFEDEKKFVKEFKALEEFKSLYDNLITVRDDVEKLQVDNEHKIEEFDVRYKKYNNIKIGMVAALDIDKKCSLEIDRQNEYFSRLMEKVDVIDRQEYVTMHLRGLGNLIGNSLRFMGLMLMSPFTGLIPGISMQTMATRRMIANAYRHIHLEEVNHVRYEAIDYDSELNHHLDDVNYAECLIDDALKDVDRLKEDFMSIYDSRIPGYEDTLKKITAIENKLVRNQNKVAIVKKNLKRSKKINENKIVRVRELNDKAA